VGSYLSGSYLDDDAEFDAGNATGALQPALGEAPVEGEQITLPGGIMLPKKTFYVVIGILILLVILAIIKRSRDTKPEN
jgi:hypothetical protein